MGCGPSSEDPGHSRRHGDRSHRDGPGLSHVIRPNGQNQQRGHDNNTGQNQHRRENNTGQNQHRREDDQRSRKISSQKQSQQSDRDDSNLSRFTIPKRTKDQLIPDVSVFADRDNWAKKVPEEHCRSVADLARYLAEGAQSDLNVVRAFYKWMALNICYDTEAYVTKVHRYPTDAGSVLRYRISVCDGYAKLFDALCKSAGIPCHYVAGFSKGTSYDPEVPITEDSFVNHAWNIVCVKNEWWPVDVTWGAGYMDNRNRFVWHYNELNFLTDPEVFILAHFPFMNDSHEYSASFQLLKKPRTLEDFNLTVKPDRNGLEWGIELLSHTQCVIPVQEDVTIKFRTRYVKMTNISCNFNRRRTGQDFESFVILYQTGGVFTAKVKPPEEGSYKLVLFGETEGMTRHQGLVTYIIQCTEAEENAEPYPEHFGMWGPQPKAAECGFDEGINDLNVFVSQDGNLKFSIPLKESVDTIVKLEHSQTSSDLESYVSDASNDKVMAVVAKLPYKGYYKMQLFACDPDGGGNSYVPVAFFFIKCLKGLKSAKPFSNSNEAQQFLQSETSKAKKKKKPPTKAPTPPTPSEDEEEEDDEDENDQEEEDTDTKTQLPAQGRTSRYNNSNQQQNRRPTRVKHSDTDRDDERSDTKNPNAYPNNETESGTLYDEGVINGSLSHYDQNDVLRYDPYTRTMMPRVVRPQRQQKKPKKKEYENYEEEDEDEDEEEDDNLGLSRPTQIRHQYERRRVRPVVPAVEREEEDEDEDNEEDEKEEKDEDEDNEEDEKEGEGDKTSNVATESGENAEDENKTKRVPSRSYWSDDQEKGEETEEEKEETEKATTPRRAPQNPHQSVHRISTVRQPKIQTDKGYEEERAEDEDENEDDNDDDEEDHIKRTGPPQHFYNNPYNPEYLGPGYSDPHLQRQGSLSSHPTDRHVSPAHSTTDLRNLYPGQSLDPRTGYVSPAHSTTDLRNLYPGQSLDPRTGYLSPAHSTTDLRNLYPGQGLDPRTGYVSPAHSTTDLRNLYPGQGLDPQTGYVSPAHSTTDLRSLYPGQGLDPRTGYVSPAHSTTDLRSLYQGQSLDHRTGYVSPAHSTVDLRNPYQVHSPRTVHRPY